MATTSLNGRTPETIRREIETEREQLAHAVEDLREGLGAATDVAGKLRANLPVVAASALGAGFFLAGGIGATMRFLARKGRER
ncbi:MAG: DUF3618 domain-containing protein [Actinobacteria bacterium]|nr:DUF3618 domain-containing protein [Actinomycetota bacterium]